MNKRINPQTKSDPKICLFQNLCTVHACSVVYSLNDKNTRINIQKINKKKVETETLEWYNYLNFHKPITLIVSLQLKCKPFILIQKIQVSV